MTGGYLASQIRRWRIRPIIAFREYIFRDVVPQFSRLNERADQIASEYFNNAINQPAGEDCNGDLSGFAEDSHNHALSWYETMRSLRQTMLNLLAAGLFHLTEQQLAQLGNDAVFDNRRPRSASIGDIVKWYKSVLRLDLEQLSGWPLIDELRLVANTAKHAEGTSCAELRCLRPDLFCDPTFAQIYQGMGIKDYFENRQVSAPLAGEDLYVSEEILHSDLGTTHIEPGLDKLNVAPPRRGHRAKLHSVPQSSTTACRLPTSCRCGWMWAPILPAARSRPRKSAAACLRRSSRRNVKWRAYPRSSISHV